MTPRGPATVSPALLAQAKAAFISGRAPSVRVALDVAGIPQDRYRAVARFAQFDGWEATRNQAVSSAAAPLAVPPQPSQEALFNVSQEAHKERVQAVQRVARWRAVVDHHAGFSPPQNDTILHPSQPVQNQSLSQENLPPPNGNCNLVSPNITQLDPETLDILTKVDSRLHDMAASALGLNQKGVAVQINMGAEVMSHLEAVREAVAAGRMPLDSLPDPSTVTLDVDAEKMPPEAPPAPPAALPAPQDQAPPPVSAMGPTPPPVAVEPPKPSEMQAGKP